jgi:hypothetical protein
MSVRLTSRLLAILLPVAVGAAAQSPTRSPVDAASPCSIEVKPSKTEVTVGESFTVEVAADGPSGTDYFFPEYAGDDSIELRTIPSGPNASALPSGAHRYNAAVFSLGEVSIPPISVKYRLSDGAEGTISSRAVPLTIVSALPKDPEQQKLADVRAPVGLSIAPVVYVAVAILLLLAAFVVFWLVRRRRRQKTGSQSTAAPPIPPDVEAREALERLAAQNLPGRGEFRAYYIALAEIAKRYLERRLERPVLEMTSAETVAFLRDHHQTGGLAPPMRDLSGAADRVKFARGKGLEDEAARHLDFTRHMIQTLEERLRPRAEESSAVKSDGKVA